jgi:hypothetical protein
LTPVDVGARIDNDYIMEDEIISEEARKLQGENKRNKGNDLPKWQATTNLIVDKILDMTLPLKLNQASAVSPALAFELMKKIRNMESLTTVPGPVTERVQTNEILARNKISGGPNIRARTKSSVRAQSMRRHRLAN